MKLAPLSDGWTGNRKAQLRVAERDEFVTTFISRDVCETDDIHPPTKSLLAKRIADAL